MKIYQYNFSKFGHELSMRALEVEEKEKTYVTVGGKRKSIIKKSFIEAVNSDYPDWELYLLEEDEKKAKELFSLAIENYVEQVKSRIKAQEEMIADFECLVKKWKGEI